MTDFTFTIDDKSQLLGISAAREAHNAALPAEIQDGEGKEGKPIMVANPALIETDQTYLQMVVDGAARSYAKQHGTDVTEIDGQISELQAKRAAIVGKGGDVAETAVAA